MDPLTDGSARSHPPTSQKTASRVTSKQLTPKKFGPFRWRELIRKFFSRRFLAPSEGEIAALTTAMRQLGVGSQGGAEALAIFHQLLSDEWVAGSLNEPLTRIKIDEKKRFGMIESQAVREAASRFLPKHTAAAWTRRNLSHVEQEGLPPMPKDRGAEQGHVDGPHECSLAFEMVAAKTRGRIAAQQAAGSSHGLASTILQISSACKQNTQSDCRKPPTSSWVARRNSPEPMTRGTCGTWMMVTFCVTQSWCLLTCRNSTPPTPMSEHRKHIIYCVNDLDTVPPEWRIQDVQNMAKVSAVTAGSITLGVAVAPRQCIADQLLAKGRRHSSNARTSSVVSGPAHGIYPLLRESWSQPHQSHSVIARSHDPAGATSR